MSPTVAALVLAIALGAALTVRIDGITERDLVDARDATLLGGLALVCAALVWANEIWLAAIAASYLVHWRSNRELPGLVCWIGIGAAWIGAQRLVWAVSAR